MSHTMLVTGANRGLGLEFVRQYADEGWRILACCRQPEEADLLQQLANQHEKVEILALDVLDPASLNALGEHLQGRPIDLLIHNAGIYGPKGLSLQEVAEDDWMTVLHTNVLAPFFVVRKLLPNIEAGSLKKIAILTSKMGSIGDNTSGGSYIYRSSKAGANAVVQSLAIDLAEKGICVQALHPGWVKTNMGGPNALIEPPQSVEGMRGVIAEMSLDDSEIFKAYDGEAIPW